jgi:hypothetical protein
MAEDDKDSHADMDYMTMTAIPNDKPPWNTIKLWQHSNNKQHGIKFMTVYWQQFSPHG